MTMTHWICFPGKIQHLEEDMLSVSSKLCIYSAVEPMGMGKN